MFQHNSRPVHTVGVDAPNAHVTKSHHVLCGGPNGEIRAALRYFSQAWNDPHERRPAMLADITIETLSHRSGGRSFSSPTDRRQTKPTRSTIISDGQHERYMELSIIAPTSVLSVCWPAFINSAGRRFSADWVDTIGQSSVGLRSDIAAEARAKLVYERLIKQCDDASLKDSLVFVMTREITHQQMHEAALADIPTNFPQGSLPGDETIARIHTRTPMTPWLRASGIRSRLRAQGWMELHACHRSARTRVGAGHPLAP